MSGNYYLFVNDLYAAILPDYPKSDPVRELVIDRSLPMVYAPFDERKRPLRLIIDTRLLHECAIDIKLFRGMHRHVCDISIRKGQRLENATEVLGFGQCSFMYARVNDVTREGVARFSFRDYREKHEECDNVCIP